jgi:uncharacterized membrane protein YbhN (UPF0104 family)
MGSRASSSASVGRDVLTHEAPAYARQLRRGVITLVVFVALVAGLLAAVPGLHGVTRPLSRISPGWIGLAVALEVLSGVGYVIAFQLVFARVPERTAARVAWAEMAFQAVVPAGGAGGFVLGGWLLHERGTPWGRIVERSAVLFLLTSAINVAALAIFGFLLAVGLVPGPHRLLLGALPAVVGAAVLVFAIALPRILASAASTRARGYARLTRALEGLAESVRDTERFLLRGDWRLVGAVGYLAFDIMVLWVFLRGLGGQPDASPLVLGYLIGYLANAIPIPGGIGALDGGLVGALAAYGVGGATATSAVLAYHAIALAVPLVIGTIAFVLLRRQVAEPITGP